MSSSSSRPLLSASLIVKDEEAMLPRCLAALQGVVDEIVVLDTGSSDRTVEIAEEAGAIVHRTEWHDDFARARNESLSHCRGRWVIYVDADEVLTVDDVAAFRKDLARTAVEAYAVRIENVQDHGGSIHFTHDPVRLFRRTRFAFDGRIHEHVVPLTKRAVNKKRSHALAITHFGYSAEVVAKKSKVDRNVRLAQTAWEANPDDVLARIELARSLVSTSRHSETLEHLEVLRESGLSARHTALHLGVGVLLRMGSLDRALEWAEELRELGAPTTNAAKQHGDVLFRLGRYEEALEVLREAPEDGSGIGVHGTHETTASVKVLEARVLSILGRDDEAADLLVSIAASGPDSMWPKMIELLERRGELALAVPPFFDGLAQLGETRARGVLAALSNGPVELGDAFFEVLAAHPGGLPYALAFVLANAERLTADRAGAWSSVARAAGLEDSCPLVRQMNAAHLPATQRVMTAAMVIGTFEDERGRSSLRLTAAALDDDEVTEALYIISELAPESLMELTAGFVSSQRRALVLADALVELGAHEQAIAVLHFGLEDCVPDPFSLDTITETLTKLEALA